LTNPPDPDKYGSMDAVSCHHCQDEFALRRFLPGGLIIVLCDNCHDELMEEALGWPMAKEAECE
jgi:hypothetical protein